MSRFGMRLGGAGIACAWLSGLAAGELVTIPAQDRDVRDERTGINAHVHVDAFRIAIHETTQEEYQAISGSTPSRRRGARLPVDRVSWWDAIRYCNARSVREHLAPCYDLATGICDRRRNGYRLPTEAEWVSAAADHAVPGAGIEVIARLGLRDTTQVPALLSRVEQGPAPAGSLAPNRFGVYDMLGNVWEWCQDRFDAVQTVSAALGPVEPGSGRVIRGGSYATSPAWPKGYRSSLDPNTRSRFTGFRVVRSEPAGSAAAGDHSWMDAYHQPPPGFESGTGSLSSLLGAGSPPITTVEGWQRQRTELRAKWRTMLGACQPEVRQPALRVLRRVPAHGYTGTLADLEVEPGVFERIYVLEPEGPRQRRGVVIVPFYDVDAAAGEDLGGRNFTPPGVRSFALLAVQQGYLAVAVRWFGENDGESYAEAVANLAARHPGCTGMGKWVADARTLVNYVSSRSDVDAARIAMIGHSLGGKMALYAAAFDERISVAVASEPGIGLAQSNYDAYWYFGAGLAGAPRGTDQHELLGMLAPRPFLLIGGDQSDTAESWRYIHAAEAVYGLFGAAREIGYFNHHQGHSPTAEAAWRAMEWIRRHFAGNR